MDNFLELPQGGFQLRRLPFRKLELLKAWDAADVYLLTHLAEHEALGADSRIVILNDGFGALAVALNAYSPLALSDSVLSQQATRNNLDLNGIARSRVILQASLTL
jgi:16S rRNA (guanine1207-N2)-methyltransferase